jgi:glycosyltransferase involved in cell wall biosynthesis
MIEIWFWQNIVSPHVGSLVEELASNGYRLTYVAEKPMSNDRIKQGWLPPEIKNVRLIYVQSQYEVASLVKKAPVDVIHISAGLRSTGIVKYAQKELSILNRKQWVIMESISNTGFIGFLRKVFYRNLIFFKFKNLQGILAIGSETKDWLKDVGFPFKKIYSFSYFLPAPQEIEFQKLILPKSERFRFIFVGQFIERKNLKLLIDSLSFLDKIDFEFIVIGSGKLENSLHSYAKSKLSSKLLWIGKLHQSDVKSAIRQADCLVLPSFFDGWGAVVAESLIVGTPAICSDTCGSSNIVVASRIGGVFNNNNQDQLTKLLAHQLGQGRIAPVKRKEIVEWAKSLQAKAGAIYLEKIIKHSENKSELMLKEFLEVNKM